jgi:hypothetical protein
VDPPPGRPGGRTSMRCRGGARERCRSTPAALTRGSAARLPVVAPSGLQPNPTGLPVTRPCRATAWSAATRSIRSASRMMSGPHAGRGGTSVRGSRSRGRTSWSKCCAGPTRLLIDAGAARRSWPPSAHEGLGMPGTQRSRAWAMPVRRPSSMCGCPSRGRGHTRSEGGRRVQEEVGKASGAGVKAPRKGNGPGTFGPGHPTRSGRGWARAGGEQPAGLTQARSHIYHYP